MKVGLEGRKLGGELHKLNFEEWKGLVDAVSAEDSAALDVLVVLAMYSICYIIK